MKQRIKFSNEEILRSAPVNISIKTLAIPAIISTLILAIYNFVDTLFIGMLGSNEALTAVGVAFPIMALLNAIGQILGAGAASSIGRYLGSGNKDNASKIASTVVATSFISGLFFMTFGLLFNDYIFKIFGASEAVMPYAKQYGTWMFIGAIFAIPNQSFNNIARAETNVTLSMKALSIGAICNVILDPIFMFAFNMGIEGASIATTISQGISFFVIAMPFFRGRSLVKLKFSNIKPTLSLYGEVLKTGAPIGISQILISVAVSLTNLTAASLGSQGDKIVAAYGVVLKVIVIGQYIVFGYLQGYQPIAAYSYGAENGDRFKAAYKYVKKFLIIICSAVTFAYILLSYPLVRMFTSDSQVLKHGTYILISHTIFFLPMSLTTMKITIFQATGKGIAGLFLSSIRQGICYIPLILSLPLFLKEWGIYLAQPIADIVAFLFSIVLFSKAKKQFAQELKQY